MLGGVGGRSFEILLWIYSVEYIIYQTSAGLRGGFGNIILSSIFCILLG
jgi:hypothetical protein